MNSAKEIHNEWVHGTQPDEPDLEEQDDIELEEEDLDYDEATRIYERNLER